MAEHDIEEKIESLRRFQKEIGPCEVITGGRDKKRFLLYQLELSMLKAERIDMIVSFLMESGVRMILDDLEQALAGVSDSVLKTRGEAAVERMRGPEGIEANYKWVS